MPLQQGLAHRLVPSQRDLIEGNETSSQRQNSEDRNGGYAESGCGDDAENDGCGSRFGWWEGHRSSKAHQFLEIALEAGPSY